MTPQLKDLILSALRIGEDEIRFVYLPTDSICKDPYGIKSGKIRAAIKQLEAMPTTEEEMKLTINSAASEPNIDDMVNRFLGWSLPKDVVPETCVCDANYPYRHGTNLMNADQAKAMFEYCLGVEARPNPAPEPQEPNKCTGCNGRGEVGNILDTVECPYCHGHGIETNIAPKSVAPEPQNDFDINVSGRTVPDDESHDDLLKITVPHGDNAIVAKIATLKAGEIYAGLILGKKRRK